MLELIILKNKNPIVKTFTYLLTLYSLKRAAVYIEQNFIYNFSIRFILENYITILISVAINSYYLKASSPRFADIFSVILTISLLVR